MLFYVFVGLNSNTILAMQFAEVESNELHLLALL